MQVSKKKLPKTLDGLATNAFRFIGIGVIFMVILILFLIVEVALPLFSSSDPEVAFQKPLHHDVQRGAVLDVGLGDYLETSYFITKNGKIAFYALGPKGPEKLVKEAALREGASFGLSKVEARAGGFKTLIYEDGFESLVEIKFRPVFADDGKRSIVPSVKIHHTREKVDGEASRDLVQLVKSLEGSVTTLYMQDGSRIVVEAQKEDEEDSDLFGDDDSGEDSSSSVVTFEAQASSKIIKTLLSRDGKTAYAVTKEGVLVYDIDEDGFSEPELIKPLSKAPIRHLGLVLGGNSLLVGDSDGRIFAMTRSPSADGVRRFTLMRELSSHKSQVTHFMASARNKSVVSLDKDGLVTIDYLTNGKTIFSSEQQKVKLFGYAPRNNALIALSEDHKLILWHLDIPHPEVSFDTYFSKVHYEGFSKEKFIWQSTGGTDEFEPKLSMVPLIFGTLKGAFFAMILAFPIALFAAVYVSQFASPKSRAIIKPAVEMMAALPSVVIGYLAALWLAPLLESHLVAFLLAGILLPMIFFGFIVAWNKLRDIDTLKKIESGRELVMILPLVVLGVMICGAMGPYIETLMFGGDLSHWLLESHQILIDQRNSIVIAIALGFAVIPIIFSISEDSLSNIPRTYSAASYALGASRWQTVWKVVIPSASPGVFAATMIGFGRAIGETMIVLMATGNTPIMDFSPFNGMRTLAANIAVEAPEAPVGGTLYRTLFLSAIILFAMTFVLNTAAEVVRHRLRRKYGKF